MILGDKNRSLILTNENITIVRESSTIKYDQEFKKEYSSSILSMPRSFGDKLYDYSENKITSLQNQEFKEFSVDPILDYFKEGKDFFFIKQQKDSSLSLLNSKSVKILNFKSPYTICNSSFYYLDNSKIMKFSLINSQRSEVIQFGKEPVLFCVKEGTTDATELVCYADLSNRIHINQGNSSKIYHWMCNRILSLTPNDDYIVAVSKSGDVAQFHSKIQKIEPLFKFNGEFLDIKINNSKIYFLTDFEFKVFSLMTNTIIHQEYLVPSPSNFSHGKISRFISLDETDVFKFKRKSTVEILNSIENKREQLLTGIFYTQGTHTFVFEPKEKEIVSVFQMDEENNFVSDRHVFSLSQRKSNCIVKVYDLFLDKLVLKNTMSISTKSKLRAKNCFYLSEKFYVQTENEISVLNKLNILEFITRVNSDSIIKSSKDFLYISDEKGIFNVVTLKYEIKQKNIRKFCIFKSKIIFYIENMGIYIDFPDRVQILEITNVIDLYFDDLANDGLIYILYHHSSGKVKLAQYKGLQNVDFSNLDKSKSCTDLKLELIDEVDVDNTANVILTKNLFASRNNRLVL